MPVILDQPSWTYLMWNLRYPGQPAVIVSAFLKGPFTHWLLKNLVSSNISTLDIVLLAPEMTFQVNQVA